MKNLLIVDVNLIYIYVAYMYVYLLCELFQITEMSVQYSNISGMNYMNYPVNKQQINTDNNSPVPSGMFDYINNPNTTIGSVTNIAISGQDIETVPSISESNTNIMISKQGTPTMITTSYGLYDAPWPTIIISVIGAIIVIYIAVAPNVDENRRIFGIVLMTLWTIAWALILWVLWKEGHRASSWWLLLIPVIAMALFFIVIIILNIGSSI